MSWWIVLVLAEQGHTERAAKLYVLAWRHPLLASARCFIDSFGQRLDKVVATLSPDIGAAAQAHGQTLDLSETAAMLQAELRGLGWGQEE